MKKIAIPLVILALCLVAGLSYGFSYAGPDLVTEDFVMKFFLRPVYCNQIKPLSESRGIKSSRFIGFSVLDRPITKHLKDPVKHIEVEVIPLEDGLFSTTIQSYDYLYSRPVKEEFIGKVNRRKLNDILNKHCFSDPFTGLANKRKIWEAFRITN